MRDINTGSFVGRVIGCIAGGIIAAAVAGCGPSREELLAQHESTIQRFCIDCHNAAERTGGLSLERLDLASVGDNTETWEKVVRKLRAGVMPPSGARRPDVSARLAFVEGLESELDRSAVFNAGIPALHRLNRNEYANAIRDLLAIEIDVSSLLPPDDSSYGFDNIAGSLGVSPALLDRYLSAATKISRLAIGSGNFVPNQQTYGVPVDLTQDYHVEGLPLGTRGGLLIQHHFPVDGEYEIDVELLRDYNGILFGSTRGEQLEISINGERVQLFDLETEVTSGFVEHEPLRVRVPVQAGSHAIGVTFPKRNYAPVQDVFQPFQRSTVSLFLEGRTLFPHVGSVTIDGPHQPTGAGDTESRKRIFLCRPETADQEFSCARQIVSALARRAFRRPVTDDGLEVLMNFYRSGRDKGSFDQGIEMALRRILASPEFVFRFEHAPPDTRPGEPFRISDPEFASRLSFFLWSSIPDEELLAVATQGTLRNPATLEQQVRRMLADPRSKELVENFAGQWLYLRNLQSHVPALEEFPNFDDNLRRAFRRETELFFESIVREDRSVLDLLSADYTFVDERLARHYGIPEVRGSHFRRVTLPADSPRRGLLGHGSILTVTSYANRTSPVLRGKWILENILGTVPPDPPPNVPKLQETAAGTGRGSVPSLRERLEEHRKNPACASCHNMMDPIGFALENFDAIGRWRTEERLVPIDASTRLLDGTEIDGPSSLREALLLGYSDQFVRTVTEKLLTYALGRGLEHYDMPVVRSVARQSARQDYRFSSLIMAIVKSDSFGMRTNGEGLATVAELD